MVASLEGAGRRTSRGKPIENRDLVEKLDQLLATRTVAFEWVRGHAGHALNERADALATSPARRAAERLRRETLR